MGVPQSEIARQIGTTQSAIARLEAVRSDPRLATVQRYAESVGLRLVTVPAVSFALVAQEVGSALAHANADEALRHMIQLFDQTRRMEPQARRHALRDEPEPVGDRLPVSSTSSCRRPERID